MSNRDRNLKTYEVTLRVVHIVVSEIEAESESEAWGIAKQGGEVCDGRIVDTPDWRALFVKEVRGFDER